jgi:hypothetical protein
MYAKEEVQHPEVLHGKGGTEVSCDTLEQSGQGCRQHDVVDM